VTQSPLLSARLKLDRSKELLDEIEVAITRRSIQSKNIPFKPDPLAEIDLLTRRTWWVFYLWFDPPPPDERWGLLVGDAMHNVRSALDHLACRLVEHNGRKVTNRTAFPIWSKPPSTPEDKKRFNSAIAGMSAAHKRSIRRLQPHANPGTEEAAKLTALAALDNLDKHRLLVPLTSTIGEGKAKAPQLVTEKQVEFDYVWNEGQIATKGVELLRVSPRGDMGRVRHVDLDIPVRHTFGDTSTGLSELREIRAYVVGIVESFAPEFR
jgi:hypothetical protein